MEATTPTNSHVYNMLQKYSAVATTIMFRHLHLHECADLCIYTECRDERERARERVLRGGIMGYYTGTRRNTSFLPE